MLEVGRGLDLGQEALGPNYGSQLGLQHLEGDLALVLEVIGQIDRRHAALTEFTLDGVAAFEGCVQTSDGIGHGHTPGSDQDQHPRAGR